MTTLLLSIIKQQEYDTSLSLSFRSWLNHLLAAAVTTDNFFTSSSLATKLLQKKNFFSWNYSSK